MFAIKETNIMRITEILTESAIKELNEGPGWDAAKAGLKGVAKGVGQVAKGAAMGVPGVVGGVAKGAGAVAGGIAGMGKAAARGYKAGQAAVAGEPTDNTSKRVAPTLGKAAAASPTQSVSTYSQTKDLVAKLDKKGKQRILAILAKDLGITGQPAPAKKTVSKSAPAGTPAAKPKVVRGGKAV